MQPSSKWLTIVVVTVTTTATFLLGQSYSS